MISSMIDVECSSRSTAYFASEYGRPWLSALQNEDRIWLYDFMISQILQPKGKS